MKSGTENWKIGQYERRNGELKERKIREEERRIISHSGSSRRQKKTLRDH